MARPSRPVTRCATCQAKFKPTRTDARYCSPACRQQAHRSRAKLDDLDRQIEEARLLYWRLVAEKARGQGRSLSLVVTDESQLVNERGDVIMHGRVVGQSEPHRPGGGAAWNAWGVEAAGPPWSPPPSRGQVAAERAK
jgi:hypothetical protein